MITKDLVTQVANYLKVNIFHLFMMAYEWIEEDKDDQKPRADYDSFVRDQHVPDYVYQYCDLVIQTIE